VFQTTALIGVGVMLQGAAIAAYYVRVYGGDNATVLSIVVGFSSIVVILVAIGSASVRSRLRGYINENLFSYKFDYRLEWEKFIRALTVRESSNVQLHVLRTLAELLDSPGGGLWILRERWHQFLPVANWSMGEPDLSPIAIDDPCLAEFDDGKHAYLELTGAQASPAARVWRELHPAAWLVVPLRYREKLIGIALIHRPRAERELDWEDENLISLMALQLAAYLVQEETIQALADARQLEEFNKRFAFILHDTKNAIGQLSLLVRNVEQFGHDEEFRKDMVLTLRHSVDKLQGLLAQLRGDAGAKVPEAASAHRIDVAELVGNFVSEKRKMGLNVVVSDDAAPVYARLSDERRFLGVLEHVTTNAIEATPKGAPVSICVGLLNGSVHVAVADKGPGMTQQFIANQLFRPLRSTKEHGFGIGAYQAREIMRDLGGNIEVRSKIGEGTTVALSLPVYVSGRDVARV
jgi:putative PEP-CTERM system histidine kinase